MHRMMFEDIKKAHPDIKVTFACPHRFHDAVSDHPYLDKLVDFNSIKINEELSVFNTSSSCVRYESDTAPFGDKHRSDIWAECCGVKLTNHNMHIRLTPEELAFGEKKLSGLRDKPTIAFCPISAMPTKNLVLRQVIGTLNLLNDFNVFAVHNLPVPEFDKLNLPVFAGLKMREWMGVLAAADYVVSVDTAAFHFAGGYGKPVTGIFTWADGYLYGKYYPTATIVQLHRDTHPNWTCGPCYKWTDCTKCSGPLKPCLTEITPQMIREGIEKMLKKAK